MWEVQSNMVTRYYLITAAEHNYFMEAEDLLETCTRGFETIEEAKTAAEEIDRRDDKTYCIGGVVLLREVARASQIIVTNLNEGDE